jgi:hypothetical protein
MPNYNEGKIYKLTGKTREGNELIYIGSTTQKLCQRLAGHKTAYNQKDGCSSSQIIILGNYQITLIELFPCSCKDELTAKERYYYDLYDCVNKNRPYCSIEEHFELNRKNGKKYRTENADKINERKKVNSIKIADKLKEQRKEYNIDARNDYNIKVAEMIKEKTKEQKRKYKMKNIDKIKEQKKEYRIKRKQSQLELSQTK